MLCMARVHSLLLLPGRRISMIRVCLLCIGMIFLLLPYKGACGVKPW